MQKLPPFVGINSELRRGMVVPFLGAGVNFNMRSLPEDRWWYGENCQFLPTGGELSEYLAKESGFPLTEARDRSDLTKVSSYYVSRIGRDSLRDNLNNIFAREDYAPCSLHSYLASIDVPQLIVTTNYDELTEWAFIKANRPFYIVSHLNESRTLNKIGAVV